MFIAALLEGLGNQTGNLVDQGIKALQGHWGLLVGAIVLIAATFFILFMLKNIVANLIIGFIALLVLTFVFGVPIPLLNPIVLALTAIGGLGGVGAVLIAVFFGWL